MKIIVQIDGGDVRGVIAAYLINAIEQKTGKSLNDKVDLYSGCSAGAAIAGAKAYGISGEKIFETYFGPIINAFVCNQKKWYDPFTWLKPVYNRQLFLDALIPMLGTAKLHEVKVPFVTVAFGSCKNESHFIKSWSEHDRHFDLMQVISWSALSAAWYFGAIPASDYKWAFTSPEGETYDFVGEVFNDGGQGVNNCTLMRDLVELMAAEWDLSNEDIYIISFGSGVSDRRHSVTPYKRAKRKGQVSQVLHYFGQARKESTPIQVDALRYVMQHRKNIHFYRLDCTLPEQALKFGDIKHMDLLMECAKKLESKLPYELFQ